MRIKQISVTNLFGIFHHVIPLNMEERITIIHGKNGFGKTTLLRLINGLFNSRYSELSSIPFEEFQITFEDSSYIQVKKTEKPVDENTNQLNIELTNKNGIKSSGGLLKNDLEDIKNLGFPSFNYR